MRTLALLTILLTTLLFPALCPAAHLTPMTSQAWDEYVQAAHMRMEQRLAPGGTFLWVDEEPDRLARVKAGEIVVSPVGPNPKKVPSGLIHDWMGAAFIPDVSLQDVLPVVRDYSHYKDWYQPGVIDSKVIVTGQDKDRFSMMLMNKSVLLKTALDADYESSYIQMDAKRVYSTSQTTRVQQIQEYGSPRQHVLEEGEGSGIIWHLLAITRFMERDGGVYVELEGIALSRTIPSAFRLFVEPVVRRVSRDSLMTSLQQTGKAVQTGVQLAKSKTGSESSVPSTAGLGSAPDRSSNHSSSSGATGQVPH